MPHLSDLQTQINTLIPFQPLKNASGREKREEAENGTKGSHNEHVDVRLQ